MYKFINDDSKDRYLITVDGVDGVGKTTFITTFIQTLGYTFAQNSQDPFEIICISPFGRTKAVGKSDAQTGKRATIKWLLNNVRNGKFSYNNEQDKQIIKNLFFLSNITSLNSAESFKFDGKKIFVFDRSFVTYSVYQDENVEDFIKRYDSCIVLTDDIKNIQSRLSKRSTNDDFDSDCLLNMSKLNDKFLSMKKIFNKPQFLNYDISEIKPKLNDSFNDILQVIAKKAVYEIFNVD